ncbi:MAG: MoaD/ThiS family protein [Streptococcaceae bacterium]|jgi:molybdopterin converting factor small subunit|nr:MoaD/ThiS family protein [Streptococcaceae bacterium]
MNTVKCFAYLSEVLGDEVALALPETLNRDVVLSALTEAFPLQKDLLATCNVAIERAYVFDTHVKNRPDLEIALIPPVSGG